MAVINYRFLDRKAAKLSSSTLSAAISDILTKTYTKEGELLIDKVANRKHICSDKHQIVLNYVDVKPEWVFAQFLRTEPGAPLAIVSDSETNRSIYQVEPVSLDDGLSPFKGSLNALIRGDVILYLSKGAFRLPSLEEYLTWFLCENNAMPCDGSSISLYCKVLDPTRLRATSVNLRSNQFNKEEFTEREDQKKLIQKVFEVLNIKDIRSVPNLSEVEANVMFIFKNGRKKQTINMGKLQEVFHNVDDVANIRYSGPDGYVDDKKMILQGEKRVKASDKYNFLYDFNDAYRQLLAQFQEWKNEGLLDL